MQYVLESDAANSSQEMEAFLQSSPVKMSKMYFKAPLERVRAKPRAKPLNVKKSAYTSKIAAIVPQGVI